EPVAYITGEREFWSLPFHVSPAVLIPRPETETLVEVGLELLEEEGFHGGQPGRPSRAKSGEAPGSAPRVIDVGTGSGCVAVAIAHAHRPAKVLAMDRSVRALRIAAKNVARHDLRDRVTLRRADLLARAAPADLILSNPPYVTEKEWQALPPDIRDREPRRALLGGPDGLAVHRRIAAAAAGHLRRGGWIALEVGAGQAKTVAALYEKQAGFTDIRTVADLAGIPRVVAARKKDTQARRASGARG
ncbi:MAG: peptide chain release factor N(5)-glutamine methyltransferase, partial [Myxococcota bacterium]